MLADLTPLPVTIAPVAGEALDGYLERLGAANALPRPALVQRLSQAGAPTAFLTIAPAAPLIANLAALTRLDPVALRCCTLASMVGIDTDGLDPANKNTWRRVAARGWPPVHGTALCPRCLDEDGIWQLSWRHPWVTTCTEHRLWLVDLCPTCGRRFRSHRTLLRAVDTSPDRCGNPGGARGRGCQQPFGELDTMAAPAAALVAQRRIDDALQGRPVAVLGDLMEPRDYLRELKSLAVLLLHLAVQPGGEDLAPWAETARADSERSAGAGGVRWGLAPPANLQLRGQAIAAADEILRAASLNDAADELHPWTELTPATNDGQLGWLADHTTMTPLLARLVMTATSSRRRLATLLDSSGILLPLTAVPQVVPADLYTWHGRDARRHRPHRTPVRRPVPRPPTPQKPHVGPGRRGTRTPSRAGVEDRPRLRRRPPRLGRRLHSGADPSRERTRPRGRLPRAGERRTTPRAPPRLVPPLGADPSAREPHGQPAVRRHLALDRVRARTHRHQPRLATPAKEPRRAHYRSYVGRLDQAATDALTLLVQSTAVAKRRTG